MQLNRRGLGPGAAKVHLQREIGASTCRRLPQILRFVESRKDDGSGRRDFSARPLQRTRMLLQKDNPILGALHIAPEEAVFSDDIEDQPGRKKGWPSLCRARRLFSARCVMFISSDSKS